MLIAEFARALRVRAATFADMATLTSDDEVAHIVTFTPENLFDIRDALIEAASRIETQQVAIREQNDILSVIQHQQVEERQRLHRALVDLGNANTLLNKHGIR